MNEKVTFGHLIVLAWIAAAVVLTIKACFIPAISITVVVSLVSLFYARNMPDSVIINCLYGGLVICVFWGILSMEEFNFNLFLNAVLVSGLMSLVLLFMNQSALASVLDIFHSPTPRVGGNSPEDMMAGCVVWIALKIIQLFFALCLGILFAIFLYCGAIKDLYSRATMPTLNPRFFSEISRSVSSAWKEMKKKKKENEIKKKENEKKENEKKEITWL